MKKDAKLPENGRPFRLAHQTLCITGFNFERESLVGYVELLVHPLQPDLRRIKINSKQCRIYRVAINDIWEATFDYNDPTLEICQGDTKQRNLDYFQASHLTAMQAVDSDLGNGEITVHVPSEAYTLVAEMKPFRICVEFSLENPQGGVKFVVPDIDGTMLERSAHLFTFGHENSSRLWFPCIDSYSEVCTWKLEFTVDMYMTAVSCGDLIETVYTSDLRKKTYHYYLSIPTAAPNIALAVGPFEVFVDPQMHEVTHFCLPHLLPILKQTVTFLHEVFEFFEELMSSRYPYPCYKQVFVDQAYSESSTYATMTIFSTNLLHPKKMIDQVPVSRQLMATAIAQQFFGCFISMNSWCDAWLPKGISAYLGSLYRKKAFGNNPYRHHIAGILKEVQEYEAQVGGIVLDSAVSKENNLYFSPKHSFTVSPQYASVYEKKAHLMMRMLENHIGRELLLQAFNKLLSLAQNAAQMKFTSNSWSHMLLSTNSFLKGLSTVTGKDVKTFIEHWAHQSGCARFVGSFNFNRKRNVVELDLKQDFSAKGALRYVGPLTVTIQELDGTFTHNFKIEENKTRFEITCHSKSRRNKKKKIPLCTGEEVDMDLNAMDADSPVLWLRVDPEITIMRHVSLEQPDYMWQYMLKYERDVIAQHEAIIALERFPTPATRLALTDTIENERCFYIIRLESAICLATVANKMVQNWAGPPAMMTIFRKMFGSHSCPDIVRQNNFSNFMHYYLQKTIPVAMATLRSIHNICPPEVLKFLLELFKYNDNCRNKWADDFYRSALIDALANTITPAVTTVTVTGGLPSTDLLTPDTKLIIEELTRYLNLEKLLPSYRLVITVSCLRTVRKMQKFGHIPIDPDIFKSYAAVGNFVDVRLAALEALVDYVKVAQCGLTLSYLLDIVEEDPEPYVRHKLVCLLVENPCFTKNDDSKLSSEVLVERLWRLMNSNFSHDARLRCDIADLYYSLYGRNRPTCLPIPETVMLLNLKERKTTMNQSVLDEDSRRFGATNSSHNSPLPQPTQPPAPIQPVPMEVNFTLANTPLASHEAMKRRAESPLDFDMAMKSSAENTIKAEPTGVEDQYKFKLKSEDVPPVPPSSYGRPIADLPIPMSSHSNPSSSSMSQSFSHPPSYSDDFLRYSSVGSSLPLQLFSNDQEGGDLSQSPPDKPMFTPPGPASTKTDNEVDVMSRLSEDSGDSSPRHPMLGAEMVAVSAFIKSDTATSVEAAKEENVVPPAPVSVPALVTRFDSSMFPSEGAGAVPSPLSSTGGPEEGSTITGKPHKAKKKKKKKDKKHKHKHKHDKERRDGDVDRPLAVSSGIILGHPLSSDASNANSPATHNAPSSPEYEVM